jgi:threonine-phosphate decarboxylase
MSAHGGNIYEVERINKINKNKILDFSSNINPFGISEIVKNSIIENLNSITRYPDPDYFDLKDSIAEFYNINVKNLIVGNGATELIFLLSRVLKPENALIISPTFLEYEKAFLQSGTKINHFPLSKESNFELDISALKKELKNKYEIVILCNPNNPTGNFIDIEKVENIINLCKNHKSLIFIDESFIDFISESEKQSSMNLLGKYENIFILKSLTKFFAIPGLRLGFTVTSNHELKQKLDNAKEPWTINTLSEVAGLNIFKDKNYIKNSKEYITREKEIFYNKLSSIQQIKVYKTSINFILIQILTNLTSKHLKEKLINDKILIRDASNFKFLNEYFFRIALKKHEENEYFFEKLKMLF